MDVSFATVLLERLSVHEDAPCIVHNGLIYSYRRVLELATPLSVRLAALLPPNAAVAVCGQLCLEWIVSDVAILIAGLVSVPIHPGSNIIVSDAMRASGACLLITDEKASDWPNRLLFNELQKFDFFPTLRRDVCEPQSFRSCMFSSGSSGAAHVKTLSDAELCRRFLSLHGKHRSKSTFCFMPVSYTTMRLSYFDTLANGGVLHVFSGNYDSFFDELQNARVTSFTAVPYIFKMMKHASIDSLGPQCVSVATIGAAVDQETWQWMRETFAEISVSDIYAASECGLISINGELVAQNIRLEPVEGAAGNVGRLIVDDFDTGDIVELSGNGCRIKVIGRAKNLAVKTDSGLFLNLHHVEHVLKQQCLDAVVFFVDNFHLVAFVETSGRDFDFDFSTLLPHERPNRVIKLEKLPRLVSSLKVDRMALWSRIDTLSTRMEELKYSGLTSKQLVAQTSSATIDFDVECQSRKLETFKFSNESEKERTKVLLTGATGFLGGELLSQLLEDESNQVVAFVRGNGKRLFKHSRLCEISTLNDLESLNIGLIIHAAAWVHFNAPYEALKESNVELSWSLFEFAVRQGIPFTFVSSTAANLPPRNGYAASKYVAETLLRQTNYLKLVVIRPGIIGVLGGPKDLLSRFVQTVRQLNLAPIVGDDDYGSIIPVDACARIILERDASSQCYGTALVKLALLLDCCSSQETSRVSWEVFGAAVANSPTCEMYSLRHLALQNPFFVERGSTTEVFVRRETLEKLIAALE